MEVNGILNLLSSKNVSYSNKIRILKELELNPNTELYMLESKVNDGGARKAEASDMIDYGGIWVRKLYFDTTSTVHDGHEHDHDHISLLVKGRVLVEVEGYELKEFVAGDMIIIRKEKHHKITALEDDTLWFCIFPHEVNKDEYVYGDNNDPCVKEIFE